jgi:selenide,water dikinase
MSRLPLDANTEAILNAASMRCGGCGSKIGSNVLTSVLEKINIANRIHPNDNVELGIGSDAAIVKPDINRDIRHLHTVDYFRSFLTDTYLVGKIAALHALSDIYAMNGSPTTALATCIVPYGIQTKVEEELHQMLSGICDALQEERCTLIGGHSSEGMESAIGLTINGQVNVVDVFTTCNHVKIGDQLILTKALGTGTLLASDMRGKAKGIWVWGAITSMLQSNREASRILFESGCKTCTDVTGFGLIGHVAHLLKSKDGGHGVSFDLNIDSIPVLSGALEMLAAGKMSSLHDEV